MVLLQGSIVGVVCSRRSPEVWGRRGISREKQRFWWLGNGESTLELGDYGGLYIREPWKAGAHVGALINSISLLLQQNN
jgi:hypothetical protein